MTRNQQPADKQMHELLADMRIRFQSGNRIGVERAHITADEFKVLCASFANWSVVKPAPYQRITS
jgi:hypothetical protein